MADRETVIVDKGERRSHTGWIVVLIALILLVLFFMYGGFNMFSAQPGVDTTTTTPTTTAPAGTGQ